jgi:hypothetical protein
VSPVRVESVALASHSTTQVVNQQFATEVYISSWTERSAATGTRSTEVIQPPTPPPRDVSQPPWRLARRSEPTTTTPDSRESSSPFSSPTTPTSAFTKYQEWRTRRLTSVESAEQVAPWRKQQLSRKETGPSTDASPFGEVITLRRTVQSQNEAGQDQNQGNSPSSSRKNSQLPPWYSEYRTASLSQTASRMVEGFRVGGIKTHYDFHITQIKGTKKLNGCKLVSSENPKNKIYREELGSANSLADMSELTFIFDEYFPFMVKQIRETSAFD